MLSTIREALPARTEATSRRGRLPVGIRIYAIGDVHGRADLLARMRDLIAADIERSAPDRAAIVLLGDYIDRGLESRAVLDLLTSGKFPAELIPLCGNHEAMLIRFLDSPEAGEVWRRNGGIETAHSYGLDLDDLRACENLAEVAKQLAEAIPPAHHALLRSLAVSYSFGDYFFCHAGIRPGVPLDRQRDEDLLWIRDEFLSSREDFGRIVIHGHTPLEYPLVRHNAIGIDTGAYITGRLTCAVLSSEAPTFLST